MSSILSPTLASHQSRHTEANGAILNTGLMLCPCGPGQAWATQTFSSSDTLNSDARPREGNWSEEETFMEPFHHIGDQEKLILKV